MAEEERGKLEQEFERLYDLILSDDFDWDKISNRLIDMTKEPNRIFENI